MEWLKDFTIEELKEKQNMTKYYHKRYTIKILLKKMQEEGENKK